MALQSQVKLSKGVASQENRGAQGIVRPKPSAISRLRAVIAWGPSNRAMPLVATTGRSILDLPLDVGNSLLDGLLNQISGLSRSLGISLLPTRLVTNGLGAKLLFGVANLHPGLSVEPHPLEARGTAGVLADMCRNYDPDDVLLVMDGQQILHEPLSELIHELESSASVSLFAHSQDGPCSMMLVRVGCLRAISRLGMVDMHGLGLHQIAIGHRVEIVQRPRAPGCIVQSLGLYIAAVKRHHWRMLVEPDAPEADVPEFSIVEAGADVAPGVNLHDTVILKGGRVEAGAKVVRSVVCPGAVVRRRTSHADLMIIRELTAAKKRFWQWRWKK